jgi:hypothetical protein
MQEVKTVLVADLKVGDVLTGSNAVITHAPYDSTRCPVGKTNVGVKYPKDEEGFRRVWNKKTKIQIIRQNTTPFPLSFIHRVTPSHIQ